MTYNVSAQEALSRSQGGWRVGQETPNIGGGAGGGIAGTRSRLGQSHGGAGANQIKANNELWDEDTRLAAARASAVMKASASQKGWLAVQDGQVSPPRSGISSPVF